MKKRIIYGVIAIIIIVAIVILVNAFGSTDDSHVITMPSPAIDSGGSISDDGIDRIEVSSENVKTVLETITRAESFSRTYTIKTLWNGGKSTSTSTLTYWQKGDNIRMSISQGNTVRNILILGDDLYIWYNGTYGVWQSKLSESSVSMEVDRFSELVTYEDIKGIPQEDILDASYAVHLDQPCIYAEYKSGELNYIYHVYVSINTGLLVSIEKYDGEDLIYSMESDSTELSTPPDNLFSIPPKGTT